MLATPGACRFVLNHLGGCAATRARVRRARPRPQQEAAFLAH